MSSRLAVPAPSNLFQSTMTVTPSPPFAGAVAELGVGGEREELCEAEGKQRHDAGGALGVHLPSWRAASRAGAHDHAALDVS